MHDDSPELLGMQLTVEDGDWAPTPHGRFLGEILAEFNLVRGRRVLELGAGSGNHTIVMARQGAAQIVATEIAPDPLATTKKNVDHNCTPEQAAVVEYRVADWLDTAGRFQVIVSNPPFCKSGKQNRRYFIDSLILDSHKRLEPGGDLVFVQSSMADLAKTERRLDENGFRVERLAEQRGPFRDYYFEDADFMAEIRRVQGGFERVDGTYYERLYVLKATLG